LLKKSDNLFFFKKNIVLLKDLIPANYIDIHSHLLPNIDDGAKNMEQTQSLISNLRNLGFSKIITTPHIITHYYNNTFESVKETYKNTSTALWTENQTFPFLAAAEYMMDISFYNLLLEKKPLLTLKDNFVLVEMSYLRPPEQLYEFIFELQIAGYKPILAHPERYNTYHLNLSEYEKLKKAGCLFQLNLLSTVGYYGNFVSKTADYLLQNDMIDFVGSDVHHQKHVDSFSNKIVIKNLKKLEIAIDKNSFFEF
jgi:protein-tyrosine phosphatase